LDPRFAALFLAGTAVLLAATALATGPISAFLCSPLALGLVALAVDLWRELTPRNTRWLVGGGGAVLAAGLVLALAGPGAAGLATAVAGLGVILCGTQLALLFDPPPPGQALPSRLGAPLNAGVAFDEAVKLAWELEGSARRRGRRDLGRIAEEVRAAAERNAERGWLVHPERAHPVPPTLEKPKLVSRHLRGAGPLEHLTFASEYEPHDPEIHERYLAFERNRIAHVYLWRHRDRPRPTLICLHGYGMGRIGFDAQVFRVSWLHRSLGLDVAAVILPLHGPRAILRRSGAGFVGGHPLWTNAAFAQAIWDLRRVTGWLRSEGAPAVGIFGMSLGGYTTALFASLEPGLACAIPMIPVSSLSRLAWRPLTDAQRHAVESVGLSEELLDRAWAIHSPLHHQPRVAHRARLIVAGLADRVVPPAQPQALWEHWQKPPVHWFPGTHMVWVGQREIRRRLRTHLEATLLARGAASSLPLSRFRS
jgi:dienelactone hydrolase